MKNCEYYMQVWEYELKMWKCQAKKISNQDEYMAQMYTGINPTKQISGLSTGLKKKNTDRSFNFMQIYCVWVIWRYFCEVQTVWKNRKLV